ncbi:MAG: hypothetical protein B7Y66_05495 [Sphingobacteriia bacterium 35-36-14]|nr:MAG: hypothetical protein B7Y66_05495 [Sphingobacteriia bacterium 35-36-14]OZA63275.1 MAG: hypothetical protein B7X68_11260 [Sphingobacteriia bacterium 39-36-14]
MQRKALVLGASGLTGSYLLEILLESELYSQVTIYVRRPLGRSHPKLVEQLINFATIESWTEADDVYCCLGATIKTVKTREAFTLVDLYAPLHIAKLQLSAGSKRFLVVSAAGANPKSSVFYNKTKGRLEEALKQLNYSSIYIFQPSFILGPRKESRWLEELGIFFALKAIPIMKGRFKKYIPVHAKAIARSMAYFASHSKTGIHIIPSNIIKQWEQPDFIPTT